METKKRRRMKADKVTKAVLFCFNRDGRRCFICKQFVSLDISYKENNHAILHHVDNDPSNNPKDGSNWKVVCRRHNYALNPRGRRKHNVELSSSVIDRPREMSAEMQKNGHSEPLFRHWLHEYLTKHTEIDEDTAINTGAEIAECSVITIKRYLVKVTSTAGFAFIAYDTTADINKIYLRSGRLQPITRDKVDDTSIAA